MRSMYENVITKPTFYILDKHTIEENNKIYFSLKITSVIQGKQKSIGIFVF